MSRPSTGTDRGVPAGRLRRVVARARRRARWARELGLVVGEDKLDPRTRAVTALERWRWRRTHAVAPRAIPVFVVGVQRSGTNMMVRGFRLSPEFEVHNEDDRQAFDRFRLRSDAVIRALVERSGHAYVLFKPLCDSHRVPELLDELGTPSRGRAIWIYRAVEGRVRSAVAAFGANNLEVLSDIAAGRGLDRWQAQGLSDASLHLIRGFDYSELTPEDGAALFWLVRNSLYFDHGLHDRDDVMLVSYDTFVAEPEPTMRLLCRFLGFPYSERLVEHVERRPPRSRAPLALHPDIARRCDELQHRLDAAAAAKADRCTSG